MRYDLSSCLFYVSCLMYQLSISLALLFFHYISACCFVCFWFSYSGNFLLFIVFSFFDVVVMAVC